MSAFAHTHTHTIFIFRQTCPVDTISGPFPPFKAMVTGKGKKYQDLKQSCQALEQFISQSKKKKTNINNTI